MTTITCPHCNTTTEWYRIPEAGLERCPNCFIGTHYTTTQASATKKTSPQHKAVDPR